MNEVDQQLNKICIKLAGYVGCITSKYCISPTLYADFRTEETIDFSIPITDKDIDFRRTKEYELKTIRIDASSVLRKFSEALTDFDVVLIHGAAIALNGNAYLFTAPSGIGKTTHILKWLDYLPDAFVINGDKPFLKFQDDGVVFACGSPWAGKENLYTNTMVPLKSIILMEQAEDNYIEKISFSEAFFFLFSQIYHSADEDRMRKTMRLIQELPKTVNFWRFRCNNFKDDCFMVAYNALERDQK